MYIVSYSYEDQNDTDIHSKNITFKIYVFKLDIKF